MMHRLLGTLALTGVLMFPALGDAGPRPRVTPSTPAALSSIETVCHSMGSIAYSSALFRDQGVGRSSRNSPLPVRGASGSTPAALAICAGCTTTPPRLPNRYATRQSWRA
jgi:hypothetical protein